MSSIDPPRHTLESLRREARQWLVAVRAGQPEALARLARSHPGAAASPTLRDVQHALAREHGFSGWAPLKIAVEAAAAARREQGTLALDHFEAAALALFEAYHTGTPEAMERHYRYTWHRRAWEGMRSYVQLDLGRRPAHPGDPVPITPDEAMHLVAREHGFAGWAELQRVVATSRGHLAAKPVRLTRRGAEGAGTTLLTSRDWDAVLRRLAETPDAALHAHGQMTDDMLRRIANVPGVTTLHLGGCRMLTDEGISHLAAMPGLRHLDLSGTAITDRGLDVLRHLPRLEYLSLGGTRVTDAGAGMLAHCPALGEVTLAGTRTGDGALRALAGMTALRQLRTGHAVTDAGLALLREIPVYRTWRGGAVVMGLTSYDAAPNQLMLRGTFTDRGMEHLRGLDGLFGLQLDDAALAITARAMEPLTTLPHLGWLAVDAKDDWMPAIAAMPALRFLGAQDTVAGDDGFEALSRSTSIEYIWGRRCHNLRRRGFQALARMPALRALSVSCLNVDDQGIAALPAFPALRELMPMDIPDAGYAHVGRCTALESLVLMYCRETTDAATERITGLSALRSYFNSYTTITDRTPALLSTMDSLERITFDTCHGLTDAGLATLSRLPRLRILGASGRQLTAAVAQAFRPGVEVHVGG